MTLRTSNTKSLAILPPRATGGTGWVLRFLSELDYATVLGETIDYTEAAFDAVLSDVGSFQVTMRADDPLWERTLPDGETAPILERACVVQFLDDGIVRFEGILEDVAPQEVTDTGAPMVRLSGRGLAALLQYAVVLPLDMPSPSSLVRSTTGSPMAAWLTFFEEAVARGTVVDALTPLFTATTDAMGDGWSEVGPRDTQAGRNLLDVLKEYAEGANAAWLVTPDRKLIVAQTAGAFGADLSDSVVFTLARHQLVHDRTSTSRDVSSFVYAQGASVIAQAADSDSLAKYGRRESWVSSGSAADSTTASSVANAVLRLQKESETSRSVRVLYDAPGRRLFEDFGLADSVGIEAEGGAIEAMKVCALTVKVTADGNVEAEVTLLSRRQAAEARAKAQLDRLTGGGAGSGATSPISVVTGRETLSEWSKIVGLTGNTLEGWTTYGVTWRAEGGDPGRDGDYVLLNGEAVFWVLAPPFFDGSNWQVPITVSVGGTANPGTQIGIEFGYGDYPALPSFWPAMDFMASWAGQAVNGGPKSTTVSAGSGSAPTHYRIFEKISSGSVIRELGSGLMDPDTSLDRILCASGSNDWKSARYTPTVFSTEAVGVAVECQVNLRSGDFSGSDERAGIGVYPSTGVFGASGGPGLAVTLKGRTTLETLSDGGVVGTSTHASLLDGWHTLRLVNLLGAWHVYLDGALVQRLWHREPGLDFIPPDPLQVFLGAYGSLTVDFQSIKAWQIVGNFTLPS